MKTLFLAAAAALSLGIGSAYATGGDGSPATTLFTQIPGQQPSLATQPNHGGPAAVPATAPIHAFITRQSSGTWLFPPAASVGN